MEPTSGHAGTPSTGARDGPRVVSRGCGLAPRTTFVGDGVAVPDRDACLMWVIRARRVVGC